MQFHIAFILTCFHKGKPAIYQFSCPLLSAEIRQAEKAKKHFREMCPTRPGPSPSSRAREGLAALLPCSALRTASPPPGLLGSPGAAGGAALRTDGGPPHPADSESCVLRSPASPWRCAPQARGRPPADLSAFLFSERDRSRARLLDALLLACSCQEGDRGGVGGEARRALPPRTGRESQTSFPSKVLGFDSKEVTSNRTDGADEVPSLHRYWLLFRCKLKNKLAKQLKQVARAAKTLQCRGRRTFHGQSRAGFPVQPQREPFFAVLCLPRSLLGRVEPQLLCVASEVPSLTLTVSTLPLIPEEMLTPSCSNCV